MNKTLLTLLLLTLFALTACTGTTANVNQSSTVALTENYSNAISIEEQLIVGTFKLEGTDQAIDSQVASQLLPVWNLLKELKSSGSAADEEIHAVEEQIQATMTAEQIKAIKDMQLTQKDVSTIFQGQGSTTAVRPNTSSNAQAPAGGTVFNGAPAGGSFDPNGGPAIAPQTNSASASQSSTQNSSTVMIDEIIKLLQSKVEG